MGRRDEERANQRRRHSGGRRDEKAKERKWRQETKIKVARGKDEEEIEVKERELKKRKILGSYVQLLYLTSHLKTDI